MAKVDAFGGGVKFSLDESEFMENRAMSMDKKAKHLDSAYQTALIICAIFIDIHFQKASVIHMGDTFFNGFYPVIDASTGGKIAGMIVAADKVLPLADNNTKIVPGHGPLGNKADLTKYRDMLIVARDRVQKLKTAGKSRDESRLPITNRGKPASRSLRDEAPKSAVNSSSWEGVSFRDSVCTCAKPSSE